MRPMLAVSLLTVATNGVRLWSLSDMVLPGRGEQPRAAVTRESGLGQSPRAEKRAESVIMNSKTVPEQDLKKAEEIAKTALRDADYLQRHSSLIKNLTEVLTSGIECYEKYRSEDGRAIEDPGRIKKCHALYADVVSLLQKARALVREPGFPSSSFLLAQNLPDLRDDRKSEQGPNTKQLQERLDDLNQGLAKAEVTEKQAGQLRPYWGKVKDLSVSVDATIRCYDELKKKLTTVGRESEEDASRDMGTCEEKYRQMGSRFSDAKKAAMESGIVDEEVYSRLGVPYLNGDPKSSMDGKTQEVREQLEEVQNERDHVLKLEKDDAEAVRRINGTLYDGVYSAVLDGLVDLAKKHSKLQLLIAGRHQKSDNEAVKAAKAETERLLRGFSSRIDELVDGAAAG
ncbi:uncharacterized protein MAM_02612 [Metarhizium album ARSEF 1941]|uniref:Uncharacterized protein n=1 Tax=Metarhizium album (strain ARSEF 1941) TaxID=1081103 RepID=A0A0B2X312_METAS|nr:uncharacterized protein MAM_02612 [Metarhizium album ARSEF 1941]KHN99759.1 hypothetical protein MAM_02612 [Metarhizium album ARSEF 1941]